MLFLPGSAFTSFKRQSYSAQKEGKRGWFLAFPGLKVRVPGPISLLCRSTKRSFTLPHRLGTQQWLSGRTTEADGRKSSLGNTADAWERGLLPWPGQNLGSWGCPDDTAEPRPRPGPESAHPLPEPIPPSHTDLSYSDRVRNMVRAGESGSGYSGILRANTSPPATTSPTPPHSQDHSPSCACARHLFSPPSRPCLLLVGRSSRRGDWANELTGGPGRAGQRSFFRFKSSVVARGAWNWRRVVRIYVLRVVVNPTQDCQLRNFMAGQIVWTLVWWVPIRERLS